MSATVEDLIMAGDVQAGDVIMLPTLTSPDSTSPDSTSTDEADAVLVKTVRLGQGGFIFTVVPVGDDRPGAEKVVTLTTRVRLRKYGRAPAR